MLPTNLIFARAAIICFVLVLDQRLHGRHITAQDPLVHIPRQLLSVVGEVLAVPNIENEVQLLERAVLVSSSAFKLMMMFVSATYLSLRKQEVSVHPAEQVPACVPAERACRGESDL